MTTDQIIASLSSLGALAAAVATFLTVREMSKQRRASYRPELALSRTHVYAEAGTRSSVATDWRRAPKSSDAELTETKSIVFSIQLTNIGLAAAKNIRVKWRVPLEAAVTTINAFAKKINVEEPLGLVYSSELGPLLKSPGSSTDIAGLRYTNNIDLPQFAGLAKKWSKLVTICFQRLFHLREYLYGCRGHTSRSYPLQCN